MNIQLSEKVKNIAGIAEITTYPELIEWIFNDIPEVLLITDPKYYDIIQDLRGWFIILEEEIHSSNIIMFRAFVSMLINWFTKNGMYLEPETFRNKETYYIINEIENLDTNDNRTTMLCVDKEDAEKEAICLCFDIMERKLTKKEL